MDTDSFIIQIKTEDIYEDIADDVEKRFDTSNYEIDRPLPIGKNKKVIGLMKDELGGKIMAEFAALRPITYSYLMDDGNSNKKAKGTKECVIKGRLKFNDNKYCLLNKEISLKWQQRFKTEAHNAYNEKINKIALSSNDDKRLQTFNRITLYPYGASVGKLCKTDLLSRYKWLILMTASGKVLRDKALKNASNPVYDGYQKGLPSLRKPIMRKFKKRRVYLFII